MSFSLIIPIYNTSILSFQKCLQSIQIAKEINKPIFDFEIIIVDDGSTIIYDNLLFSFNDFLKIKYIKIESNYGRSHARNEGIHCAINDFITFLDSDDEVTNTYFNVLNKYYFNIIENNITTFGYYINKIPIYRPQSIINFKPISFNKYHFFCTNSIFIKKSILKCYNFDESISSGEDLKLWNQLLIQSNGLHINIPISIYKYDYKEYKEYKITLPILIILKKIKYFLKFYLYGSIFKSKEYTNIVN